MTRTSPDFQAGFNAAAKAKELVIAAVEQRNLKLLLLLSLAKEEIEAIHAVLHETSATCGGRELLPPSKFLAELKRLERPIDEPELAECGTS